MNAITAQMYCALGSDKETALLSDRTPNLKCLGRQTEERGEQIVRQM